MPAIKSMRYTEYDGDINTHRPGALGFRSVDSYRQIEMWYRTGRSNWRCLHAFSACGNPLMRTYYQPM